MHQVYVCAELNKRKLNLELMFTCEPSAAEFVSYVERVFRYEQGQHQELQECEPFKVHRIHIFDKPLGEWMELVTNRFPAFTQLYVFQQQGGAAHRCETQHDIPVPRALTLSTEMPRRPEIVTGK
eukprot:TRINITY_DN11260_c0_g2_i1.p1 TRINITY_DN11260_c0_g2~~TRINITY_DN11260_c0_g2_i1.p1  ORF type:complete len:125 (+),score=12.96 TRINITY_DN11260_c0_g2_i1:49-423(+)